MKLEGKRPKKEIVNICFFLLGCIVYGIVSVTLFRGVIPFMMIVGAFYFLGQIYYNYFDKKFSEEGAPEDKKTAGTLQSKTVNDGTVPMKKRDLTPKTTQVEKNVVIEPSSDYLWVMVSREKEYYFTYTGGNKLDYVKTPSGLRVHTPYRELAERILKDLEKYGYNYRSADTILSWQFTFLENFSSMSHEQLEQVLDQCFLQKPDWTFAVNQNNKDWITSFGREPERKAMIRKWLSKCTNMQMTAACCIGNAYHSLNIAFVLAEMMEKWEFIDESVDFNNLTNLIANNSTYGPSSVLVSDFRTFELYYGLHYKENGNIICEKGCVKRRSPNRII